MVRRAFASARRLALFRETDHVCWSSQPQRAAGRSNSLLTLQRDDRPTMRAELEKIVDEIRESMAILRRHL